ncbi:MAG TPA: MFS transporter [Steroidobacteraceae bacterium]|nr:MFS transporter [Steroidobacteraceae bacterium]
MSTQEPVLQRSRRLTASTRMVLLLAVGLLINYVDRGNLATAAPLIQDQLHLSHTQLGYLLSAFYFSYVAAMAPVGWVAERYGAHRILGVGLAIWALATMLTGFATGFVSLLLLRLLLGLGESAGFPCSSKLIATAVEPASLGTANGVIAFGYLIGPALGTLVGGLLMSSFGWRPVFVLFGILSALWLWPWSRVKIEPVARAAANVTEGPAFGEILRQRGLWGASLGHFASNYTLYFILSWLPEYLMKERGFSMQTMAGVAGIAYLVNAVAALLGGRGADAWIRSGRSASTIYKFMMAVSHLASIAVMAGMALLSARGSVISLFIYEIFLGASSPGIFAIPQIMAGPAAAGRWVGVQNTCGNVAGILAPAITGITIDATGSFSSAFGVASLVNVLGLVGWLVVLPRVAPLRWNFMRAH